MKNMRYQITDWIFFFNKKNTDDINNYVINNPENKELESEFITWKLITVVLPVVTFLFAVLLNLITCGDNPSDFLVFFNNGSLPIISFGILTSGMPYLLEELQNYPDLQVVRRRVMAISLFFLFLSASLYILQTLKILTDSYSIIINSLLLILSVYIFLFSSTTGYKMFLLQSKNVKSYEDNLNDTVKDLKRSLEDL